MLANPFPAVLPDLASGCIAVLGDIMLDRYWHGSTHRISPEAPVPVVRVDTDESRPGGAANVAANIAALGARARLFGLVGKDEAAHKLAFSLKQQHIESHALTVASHPTITKLRIISRHQQLIRLDFENRFSATEAEGLETSLRAHLAGSQALVLSDYDKGTLSQAQTFIAIAHEHRLPVIVDPKGSDFSRYRGATVLTPNLGEFEAIVGACPDEAALLERGENLRAALDLQALLVTRSERGMTLIQRALPPLNLPARAREVFDVTGAGDTVVAVLAAGLACGCRLAEATALGNLAAGLVVGKLGTASVTHAELAEALALEARHAQTRPAF